MATQKDPAIEEAAIDVKKNMTDAQLDKVTSETAKDLAKQDKVKVKLHLPPDQKKALQAAEEAGKKVEWPYTVVGVNGHNYQIQLGKEVEVPQTVAEILEQAGMI